ncbi:RNA polymerase sigma factor [Azonexus hydrophilus]|uniref:RNA polymerase sigma factor n=1 Tax=Azonexus hydrophilus TaxID=418702 RepID=A0ABZ2XEG8_9RHOO|nr:RNA polymerase sigma factor [Azonexus hydrophilus]
MVKVPPEKQQHPCLFAERTILASPHQLATFLESSERRAFKQALYAVREEEAALDIVQDAMMKLAEKYGDRPAEEFPMLFQRILQNTIRDHFRRSKVRNLWTTALSVFSQDDDEQDPLDTLQSGQDQGNAKTPESELLQSRTLAVIENEIKKLPPRQREAFVMRYWEEMDVAETANAMGCSEGSVKTHCSRATHTLAAALAAMGISL